MTRCPRCHKDVDPSLEHSCTPPATYAAEDLLNRLDGLERFTPDQEAEWPAHPMKRNRNGNWVRFEQVKTIVGQWAAEQGRV